MSHAHESVRLVATDALAKNRALWAIPELVRALDDDYLLNRQFAQKGLEDMLDVSLADHGYVFYMTKPERLPAIERIHRHLSETDVAGDRSPPQKRN